MSEYGFSQKYIVALIFVAQNQLTGFYTRAAIYSGIYGSEKTRILVYFTQCSMLSNILKQSLENAGKHSTREEQC